MNPPVFVFSDHFRTTQALTIPAQYQEPNFTNGSSTTVRSWLQVVAVGDFNRDGMDDVVLTAVDARHVPFILYSKGDGTFQQLAQIDGDATRFFIRNGQIVDLNQDGWLDFVGFESTHLMKGQRDLILMNRQGNRFEVIPMGVSETAGHHGGVVADFNGDGLKDILGIREFGYLTYTGPDLRAPLLQQADGSFRLSSSVLPAELERYALATAAAADLNGDGVEDLVLGLTRMALQQGGEALTSQMLSQTPLLAVAFGRKDLPLDRWEFQYYGRHWAAESNTLESFFKVNGEPDPTATAGANSLKLLDINRDGHMDIVVGSYLSSGFLHRSGGFQVFINRDNRFVDETAAFFPDQREIRRFDRGFNFTYNLVDLNGDGVMDFLVTSNGAVNWPENARFGTYPTIYLGFGDHYLPVSVEGMRVFDNTVVGAYDLPYSFSGDFNGDGVPDLLSLREENSFGWGIPSNTNKTGYVVVLHLNRALEKELSDPMILQGTAGADVLSAAPGRTTLRGMAGDDQLIGLPGQLDTALYYGAKTDFRLELQDGELQLRDTQGTQGRDLLRNIDRLRFSDGEVILDSRSHSGFGDLPLSVYQFFILAFGAAPGVEYLQQCADAYRGGASVQLITNVFTSKSQFTDIYPTALSNSEMARKLVTNVVGTSATQAARDEAVRDIAGALDNGLSRGDMIFTVFSNLAALKGDAKWGGTAQLFFNQIAVAKYYTETMNQSTTDRATLTAAISAVTAASDVATDAALVTLVGQGLLGS